MGLNNRLFQEEKRKEQSQETGDGSAPADPRYNDCGADTAIAVRSGIQTAVSDAGMLL